VKKKVIRKTIKGSIAKVRRRYPGTASASLQDTSSEDSVSSGCGSIGSSRRSSGSKKAVAKDNLTELRASGRELLRLRPN